MDMSTARLCELPSPSGSLLAVINYCSGEDTDAGHLANLIKADPVMSAELLRIVNSPYFGFGGNITSIGRIVVLMGLKAIRSLALCIAVRNLSQAKKIPGFDDNIFWEDCIRHAVISSVLAETTSLDKDECFTAGLLQDIGLLVIANDRQRNEKFFTRYYQLNPDLRKIMEREEFKASHDSVVSFLSNHWSLPSSMVEAIGRHHDDSAEPTKSPDLADVLYCADWLNILLTSGQRENVYLRCIDLLTNRLHVKRKKAQEIIDKLPNEIAEAGHAFDRNIRIETVNHEQILQCAALRLAENNLELHELTALLKKTIKERDYLEETLQRDIQVAREVQQALLPESASDPDVYAFNMPARDLSGDFYDFFRLPDGRLAFCFGDVSGKGVNSSLLMVKACSLYRSLGRHIPDIAELATNLNAELHPNMVRGMFITMVFGLYDASSGVVELVNAGHLPVITVDNNAHCRTYEAHSPPLGILADSTYRTETIEIRGKSLYLYSDGVSEAVADDSGMPGLAGLVALLVETNDKQPADRMALFQGRLRQRCMNLHDDTSMLLVCA